MDPDRARRGPFGRTIAHGLLTLSLTSTLLQQIFEVHATALGVNAGADQLRFLAPVPVGSRVRAGAELLSVATLQGGNVEARFRITVEVEGATQPACVADWIGLYVAER